jgi:copper chaperone CopZ
MSKITLKIVGDRTMHCGGCENGVRFSLNQVPGVIEVNPDRATQLVEVIADPGIAVETLSAQMDQLGYQVQVLN